MKRILVALHGTRGDIQPGLAVAHALQVAGNDVTLLVPQAFASWVAPSMRCIFVPIDLRAQVTTSKMLAAFHAGSPRGFARIAEEFENQSDSAFQQFLVDASDGVEAIIAHPMLIERAWAVAEFRGIRLMPYCTLPMWPTRDFGATLLGGPQWGSFNWVSHALLYHLLWRQQRSMIQAWRKRLGLAPAKEMYLSRMQREQLPSIETYSETLCPKPSDWGTRRLMTGLVRPPPELRARMGETTLPEELEHWLATGAPPIFITFGSQPLLGRPGLVAALRSVLSARGLRAIFDLGWSPLDPPLNDATTFCLRGVNHAALLPRCTAAMHHGGAGSTAAASEAGIPSIVCAAVLDQPFWGKRIEALGCGRWVKYRKLTEQTFGTALDAVLTEPVRQRAREVGRMIALEQGLANVARMVAESLGEQSHG